MLRVAAILILWAATLRGSLALRHMPGDWGHGLCGAWGCGPPLQALLAVHTAWLLVVVPVGLAIVWAMPHATRRNRFVANAVIAVGATAAALILGYEFIVRGPEVGLHAGDFWSQRCAFALLTAVDFPVIQTLVGGVLMRQRIRRGVRGGVWDSIAESG